MEDSAGGGGPFQAFLSPGKALTDPGLGHQATLPKG